MQGLVMSLVLIMGMQEQVSDSAEASRAAAFEQARREKAGNLQAPKQTFLEKGLQEFKDRRIMERFSEGFHGLHPIVGGLRTGSGFGGGTFIETEGIRASAQASIKGYQQYDLRVTAPLKSEFLFSEFRATYRNFSQERFFGVGPDSRKENQTTYRLEDTNYVGRFGVAPTKRVKAGVFAGWLETNVGKGTSRRSPSIETRFEPGEVPALESQPNYLQAGLFFEADYRDEAGNPRSGGRYTATWTKYEDRKLGRYDFAQYDVEAQQYLPFFNKRRVVVLRAKTTMTQTAAGQDVPFFMQPSLGGSEDLRGFREYRFRDRNMVVLNAEYRWEAFSGLDLAAFADAGQVAPKAGDLRFSNFEKSYGAGLRFNTAKSVFLRMDLGFSNEGRRLFIKFGHVF
jgi:outer membrane protein assembly factor BamA